MPALAHEEFNWSNHFSRIQFRPLLLIAAMFVWCGFLLAVRTVWTRNFDYAFLIWNLGLAFAPLFFSALFLIPRSLPIKIAIASCWLLFFPNAPYLITDFIHLRTFTSGPIWMDIILLASCAAAGLAVAYTSLHHIHDDFVRANRPFLGWGLALATLLLSGFGIYLGRFLRWRSVDVITDPLSLAADIFERLLHPFTHYRAWGVTLAFSAFLMLQ